MIACCHVLAGHDAVQARDLANLCDEEAIAIGGWPVAIERLEQKKKLKKEAAEAKKDAQKVRYCRKAMQQEYHAFNETPQTAQDLDEATEWTLQRPAEQVRCFCGLAHPAISL